MNEGNPIGKAYHIDYYNKNKEELDIMPDKEHLEKHNEVLQKLKGDCLANVGQTFKLSRNIDFQTVGVEVFISLSVNQDEETIMAANRYCYETTKKIARATMKDVSKKFLKPFVEKRKEFEDRKRG